MDNKDTKTDPEQAVFAALVKTIVIKSRALYALTLLKDYAEFVHFHAGDNKAHSVSIFSQKQELTKEDVELVSQLSKTVFPYLTRQNMYKTIEAVHERIMKTPTLILTVPVELEPQDQERIGTWVRKELGSSIMLTLNISIWYVGGCNISWQGMVRDYSLPYYAQGMREQLIKRFSQPITQAQPVVKPAS